MARPPSHVDVLREEVGRHDRHHRLSHHDSRDEDQDYRGGAVGHTTRDVSGGPSNVRLGVTVRPAGDGKPMHLASEATGRLESLHLPQSVTRRTEGGVTAPGQAVAGSQTRSGRYVMFIPV